MLSDLSFDIPMFPDLSISQPEDSVAPLDFDDLLDIACEFEFTHAITDLWPCEQEPSVCPETGLEDILAAIMSTPNAEESPLPLPSPAPSTILESLQLGSHTPASICAGNEPVPLPEDGCQVQREHPSVTMLQGWSPPDGSQFLELDHSLTHPQPARDVWCPPWLATFLDPSSHKVAKSFGATIPDVQPQTSTTHSPGRVVDGSRKPFVSSTRAILGPACARFAQQPYGKTSKPRPSTPAAGSSSAPKYAKPPRGGIPPHIARCVTRANILRAEKDRNVIRDVFSGAAREGKKPSVLRKEDKVDKDASKDGRSAKKFSARGGNDDKKGRATKRARA